MAPGGELPGYSVPAAVNVVVVATWVITLSALGVSVTRARLARFAGRQRLVVNTANGEQVIRYLATTRRWRIAGMVGGLALSICWSLPTGQLSVGLLPLLAGWFVGALIAEVRVTHRGYGSRRAASLVPRGPERYLPRTGRELVPAAAGLCLAFGAVSLPTAVKSPEMTVWPALVPLGLGLGVAAAVRAVWHRALHRPQPLADPDVLAADDAIRSRSLHVLSAAGAVLILYCVLAQLEVLLGEDWNLLLGFASLVVAVMGWAAAISPWQVPRPANPVASRG